jgi:glycosyltransferase involved in cell wall biosynthesis
MKILRIYTKLPPLKGGMEKHIYNLTKLQIRDNHFVKVFFNDGEEISQNDEKICKLKLHRLKPQIIGFFIFYFLIVFKLLLKKQKFDIIHIHGDWSSLLFIKLLKKFTNAKLVVLSLHGQLTSKYNHQKLLPKLVQDVDLIFSTGYDTANELEKLSGKKVIVQPSGINEIFFQEFKKDFNNSIFTLVTVANLFPKKNIEFILEIAKELKECRFIVVGEGTHRKILNQFHD